ncbi:asparagine synthase [Bradyrhizobium oligotrophicum S58]|uniref:asparagine synthase (glutamine-hydrolyzing) n=1 Tax=Bradyrhizobium oligotrophicum S58 TaxID=1245469 RepID=M4Z5F0_9BRAD|nr:asparagine synthase (glutamine-hydrolyzing) [Bradyrhizobium oligotrophicum]BAM88166.1 asparagine synthase [Bradyrhizobium oligotrophicum S58]
MCGLVGLWCWDTPIDRSAINRAIGTLHHRGPDGTGLWISDDSRVALGHTRLSIIDLATGEQPLHHPNDRLHLVVNGEFYDYERIRNELTSRGARFRSRSDSEIALWLYAEAGERCFDDLNGEFAFILWDANAGRLLAARDRFGIKPLFYAVDSGRLLLASEIKALLALGLRPQWNVDGYLDAAHALQDGTLFAGIRQVPPGCYLSATRHGVSVRRYWHDPFASAASPMTDERTTLDEVRDQMSRATRWRLRADVPVASYLSGGIDSMSVLALAAGAANRAPDAFTIAYDDAAYDESSRAQAFADRLGACFHQVPVSGAALADNFAASLWHSEVACFNPHGTAKFILSKAVREAGYKVVLTGEGADEIFAGYAPSRVDALGGGAAMQALVASRDSATYAVTPKHATAEDLPLVAQAFGTVPTWLRHQMAHLLGISELFRDDLRASWSAERPLRAMLNYMEPLNFPALGTVDLGLALMLKTTLPNYVLVTLGDRMEMAHSVEARLPFLDHKVVETAWRMPGHMKIRDGLEKYALREAMRPLLPDDVVERQKHPFVAPPSATDPKHPFGAMIRDVLHGSALASMPFFDPAKVIRLTDRLASMRDDERLRHEPLLMEIASLCVIHDLFRMSSSNSSSLKSSGELYAMDDRGLIAFG